MQYHMTGALTAILYLFAGYGLWHQLQKIWIRKKETISAQSADETPTSVLSLNQISTSFLGFYSGFLFGLSLAEFNHYLVWPRIPALVFILIILYEMVLDRKQVRAMLLFGAELVLFLATLFILVWYRQIVVDGIMFSQGLMIAVAVLISQGNLHQIILIRRKGETGAVSIRLHQITFLRDAITVLFGLTMGLSLGWPLFVQNGSNGILRGVLVWHFHWVHVSPVAQSRRALLAIERNV